MVVYMPANRPIIGSAVRIVDVKHVSMRTAGKNVNAYIRKITAVLPEYISCIVLNNN